MSISFGVLAPRPRGSDFATHEDYESLGLLAENLESDVTEGTFTLPASGVNIPVGIGYDPVRNRYELSTTDGRPEARVLVRAIVRQTS